MGLVMIGAAVGGGLRYAVGHWVTSRFDSQFPWHTFAINITGAFLLGIVMSLSVEGDVVSTEMRLLLGVGLLGGFTTFSTLSYEAVDLMSRGMWGQGAMYVLASGAIGLVAAFAGVAVGRGV